jgi:hypothetical protein
MRAGRPRSQDDWGARSVAHRAVCALFVLTAVASYAVAAAASAGPLASVFVWKAFVAAADLYRMLAGRLRAPRRSAT